MKGYTSIKEALEDYSLLIESETLDIHRRGKTLQKLIKDIISIRTEKASKQYKKATEGYTHFDFKLLAIHKSFRGNRIEEFMYEIDENLSNKEKLKRILKSKAFPRLKKIKAYFPDKLDSIEEFVDYLKTIPKSKTETILAIVRKIAGKKAVDWVFELRNKGRYFYEEFESFHPY